MQPPALGVNGKILSAGWIHKNADNNAAATGNYHIVLSIQVRSKIDTRTSKLLLNTPLTALTPLTAPLTALQGVTLDESNVMAWDYDVETVVSEPHGANQW